MISTYLHERTNGVANVVENCTRQRKLVCKLRIGLCQVRASCVNAWYALLLPPVLHMSPFLETANEQQNSNLMRERQFWTTGDGYHGTIDARYELEATLSGLSGALGAHSN